MDYCVRPMLAPIRASIHVPGSKSITNRALLLAAFARGTSYISGILLSDDTSVFIEALTELGVKLSFSTHQKSCWIEGVGGIFPHKKAVIYCKNAGTGARFLLAACAVNSGEFYFDGTDRLRMRPLSSLIDILVTQGVKIVPEKAKNMPFNLIGQCGLSGGDIFVPGDVSSQFLSGLLMASPFSKSPVILSTDHLVSRPFVALTCTMMKEFGVTVEEIELNKFRILGPQCYESRHYVVEPDLSTASYFFAAAAISNGSIKILGIDRGGCKQGDVGFLDILERMGCTVISCAEGVTVLGPKKLSGLSVDMRDISDTFMTIACLAPFADKPTTISGIAHTQSQECNRIEVVAKNLSNLGIDTIAKNDSLTIYPGKPRSGNIDTHDDHRIAMAFSLIGLLVPGITIRNMSCVSKSCPSFIELWESMIS